MSGYPDNWPEIARKAKDAVGWRCQNPKCGHVHDVKGGYVLTVHHEDGDPSNCAPENLKVRCQRCHLKEQDAAWRQRVAERKEGMEQGELAL